MKNPERTAEFEGIFDEIAYQLSSARAAGLARPDEARVALKRARDLVGEADALASMVVAQQQEASDG